jgi:hypothetical protein
VLDTDAEGHSKNATQYGDELDATVGDVEPMRRVVLEKGHAWKPKENPRRLGKLMITCQIFENELLPVFPNPFLPFIIASTHLSRSRSPLPPSGCRLQSNRCNSRAAVVAPHCAASTPCCHSFAPRRPENPSSSCHYSQRPAEQNPCGHDTACAKEAKNFGDPMVPSP